MAKYEWMNLEKTKLKMKVSEDGRLWREVSSEDPEYVTWASEEGNVADTPDHIQNGLDAAAESPASE